VTENAGDRLGTKTEEKMPKTIHPTHSRWFWTSVLVSMVANALAAQTAQPTPVPPDLKTKVKVVEVTKSGTTLSVKPDKVQLHKKQDIAVWVSNGLSMKITFKAGANPFTDLVCKGSFCVALTPPTVEGTFKYTVTVDGAVLDPNVEVVP
jgi:hypothetical protein